MSARRIRVLFDCPNPGLHGGPPTHLPLLEAELRRQVDLEIFEYGRKTDAESNFAKLLGRSKDLAKLRAKIVRYRPDLIHHNTAFDQRALLRDAPLVWIAKRYRVPVFLKMHGSLDELFGKLRPPLESLKNVVLRYADCIGVLSEQEKAKYLNSWSFLGNRVKVVKNIINERFYSIRRLEAEDPTVLFVSRFIRSKGIFDLLEAIPSVLRTYPTARFVFVGSGADAYEFDTKVRNMGLAGSVQRIEHLSNSETASFYSKAWVLVFPTHFPEGMPMVVAEAMAAGVPVITTRTNFSRSYMSEDQHCRFVEREDPVSLQEQISCLLGSRDLRNRMSLNNRELAKSFRADTVTGEFLGIYEQLYRGATAQERSC